jgi:hypothetical protein
MYLIELFLPLYDNAGEPLPRPLYDEVRRELVEQFGGLTAHSRAPAEGLWQDGGEGQADVTRDDLVIYEVMTEDLDEAWWGRYRADLENRFRQEKLVVRAHETRLL